MVLSPLILAAFTLALVSLAAPGRGLSRRACDATDSSASGAAASPSDVALAASPSSSSTDISPSDSSADTSSTHSSAVASPTDSSSSASPSDSSSDTSSVNTTDTSAGTSDSSTSTTDSSANATGTSTSNGAPVNPANPSFVPKTFPPGKKRGIVQLGEATTYAVNSFNQEGNVIWIGDYNEAPPGNLGKLQFVPQVYHWNSYTDTYYQAAISEAESYPGEKYLLAYGEAGTPGPYQLTPEEAVTHWKTTIQPLAANFTVSAPTSLCAQQDWDFLSGFLDGCTGCDIGFISFHDFGTTDGGPGGAFDRFQSYVADIIEFANNHSIPSVWVDNIQGWGSEKAIADYINLVIPYLENNPRVERYAWVSNSADDASSTKGGRFWDTNGDLNALGQYYRDYPTDGANKTVPDGLSTDCTGCDFTPTPVQL